MADTSLWIRSTVRVAVTSAVNCATRTRPASIHSMETTRPALVRATRSPYPTVAMVTMAHQMPSHTPAKYPRGKWSSFRRRSTNQMMWPTTTNRMPRPTSRKRKVLENRPARTPNRPPSSSPERTRICNPESYMGWVKSTTSDRSAVIEIAPRAAWVLPLATESIWSATVGTST